MSKVRAVTRATEKGIVYSVFVGERCVWTKRVKFGKKKANRPGGKAFQSALWEQEEALRRTEKEHAQE